MKTKPLSFFFALLSPTLWAGPVIEVRNADGKTLMIELLALDGENVVFTTTGEKSKEHTLGLAKFDTDSQEKIREEAKALPPRLPKLDIEVVVSKRREKDGYYMINQEVSAKVKLRNLSARIPFPATKGTITYFGRNRKNPDNYRVMSKRSFDVEALIPNKGTEAEVLGFKTRFDSDNKGYGNVGGYEYDSYLLILADAEGNIIANKTSDAGVRAAIEKDASKTKQLSDLAEGAVVDKNLEVQQ